ncbi:MAG: hypothetical protein MUP97_03200 [Acidimicrobiia bacterium]|nr:hypothetical protein [Acidimicrobiia bacterium]
MSTQLHLVDTRGTPPARPTRRARVTKTPKTRKGRRAAHWHTEWHLDDRTRQVGQEGVAAARQALAQARRPEEQLPRAS